jgi:hypothetical protein
MISSENNSEFETKKRKKLLCSHQQILFEFGKHF